MTSTIKITIQFLDSSEEVFEYPSSVSRSTFQFYNRVIEDIEEQRGIYNLTLIDNQGQEVDEIRQETATFTCIIGEPCCRSCGDEDVEIFKDGYCKQCYIEDICDTCFTTDIPRPYRDYIMCASTYEARWRYRVFFDKDGEQEEVIRIDADGTNHSCADDRLLSGEYDRLVLSSEVPDEIRDEFWEITIDV